MSEGKKRRVHTPEFKAKVGLEAVRGVKTISEIAQTYGVHPVLVGQWKKEILEKAGALFEVDVARGFVQQFCGRAACREGMDDH